MIRRVEAAGLKDEIRKARDEIEGIKAMQTLGETEFRGIDERFGSGARSRPRSCAAP